MDIKNKDGASPLSGANDPEIAKILIDAKADIESRTPDGFTALFLAIHNENIEIVQLLATAGADVNAIPKLESTPLKLATSLGSPSEIIKILKSAGAK